MFLRLQKGWSVTKPAEKGWVRQCPSKLITLLIWRHFLVVSTTHFAFERFFTARLLWCNEYKQFKIVSPFPFQPFVFAFQPKATIIVSGNVCWSGAFVRRGWIVCERENQWKKKLRKNLSRIFFHARLVIYNNEFPLFNFPFSLCLFGKANKKWMKSK